MAVVIAREANLSGILALGRYLSSTVESLESSMFQAELGHLPPEVDKRDEGFAEWEIKRTRADSLLFLTSEVSPLPVLTSARRKRKEREKGTQNFLPSD